MKLLLKTPHKAKRLLRDLALVSGMRDVPPHAHARHPLPTQLTCWHCVGYQGVDLNQGDPLPHRTSGMSLLFLFMLQHQTLLLPTRPTILIASCHRAPRRPPTRRACGPFGLARAGLLVILGIVSCYSAAYTI